MPGTHNTILIDHSVYLDKSNSIRCWKTLLVLFAKEALASLCLDASEVSLPTTNPLPWLTVFAFSLLAWIPTLQQAWKMFALATPLFGTMGLAFWPFLWFWTVMTVAMMFPALAPTVVTRYSREQWAGSARAFFQLIIFLSGYLLIWTAFGIPTFILAELGTQCVLSAPALGIGMGVALLVAIGLYQMTPLERRALAHCNPSLCCTPSQTPASPWLFQLREGLLHGLYCLGCCGGLMLVMVVVGLMNLPWMLLLTLVIFLEKAWRQGTRLSFFVGFSLLIFAVLALAEPALLAGLFRPL